MTTLYENNDFIMKSTGKDYDFIAVIENKTDQDLRFHQMESHDSYIPKSCYDFQFDDFEVPANDWIGLLADDDGYLIVEAIENGFFDYDAKL